MNFNSLAFLLFFPVVCIVYWLIGRCRIKLQNLFLLIASYFFYMNWEPVYALLLLSSTVSTWFCGLMMDRAESRKKVFLTLCLVINIAILFIFKYANFLTESIWSVLAIFGLRMQVPHFDILLPVGISFYTFQAIGYTIDVYRREIPATRNLLRYALFVSFFPQLVAGPIERSRNLLIQFGKQRIFDADMFIDGLKLMIWGFFMKLCVAENLAPYVNAVYNNLPNHNGTSVWMASFFFTFQLYCDFAGYSLIAIGTAKCLGFKLMQNFNHPYLLSVSIQDYWKRNHISLTSWFMDYVYYPMTEHKNTMNWWCFCIFVTFVISGFWHGANWTFVIWGAINGIALVIEMRMNKSRNKFEKKWHLNKKEWYKWLERVLTYVVVMLMLVFFRANSISDAFLAFKKMFAHLGMLYNGDGKPAIAMGIMMIFLLLFKEVKDEYKVNLNFMHNRRDLVAWSFTAVMIILILLCAKFEGGQFIYFQF